MATITGLQRTREAAGLSRRELSDRSGVSLRTIYRIEYGDVTSAKLATVRALATALTVAPEAIMRIAPAPAPAAPRALAPVAAPGDPDVLFAAELARVLRCGRERVLELLQHHPERLPRTIGRIDTRPRWSRLVVDAWIAGDPSAAGAPLELDDDEAAAPELAPASASA